jgi:hypothetical protein
MFKLTPATGLLCLMLIAPVLISGKRGDFVSLPKTFLDHKGNVNNKTRSKGSVLERADMIYDSLCLENYGINIKAFEYAWKGYQYLLKKGWLKNSAVLSICDFSQSSKNKRLYVIDLTIMKVVFNTYVAHGKNSGGEYARTFSNSANSHKSSLGFYITGTTYYGDNGFSLNLEGLESGINDKADRRRIVVHGADYLGDGFLSSSQLFNGRSYGCPAIPAEYTPDIINTIKNGSCLFIYYPTKSYLTKSRIING